MLPVPALGHANVTDDDDEGANARSKFFDDDDDDDDYISNRSYALERSNSAARDAVAASTALMGENVIDSPTQRSNSRRYNIRDRSALGTPRRSPLRCPPTDATTLGMNPPLTAEQTNALSVGIIAQGLAWARQQRDRRQRLYLQHQAEQQLRKIRQAQAEEKAASHGRSLLDNPTFQNLMHIATRASVTEEIVEKDGDPIDDEAFSVSKSGDGYSVELPVDLTCKDEDASWIPPVRVEDETDMEPCPFILAPEEMQQIAVSVLPRGIAYCRWKRLYSLARDGDSFDACLRSIASERQTLMVVRTSRDAVFGGFADAPWEGNTQGSTSYYGGPGACLFRVDPIYYSDPSRTVKESNGKEHNDENTETELAASRPKTKVKCYRWTGANRYIQLCDAKNKMLAFGGGGDDGAFGLCVEQDFQVGSTGSCATFDNEPLCDQENFEIVDMEIYGFLIGQF